LRLQLETTVSVPMTDWARSRAVSGCNQTAPDGSQSEFTTLAEMVDLGRESPLKASRCDAFNHSVNGMSSGTGKRGHVAARDIDATCRRVRVPARLEKRTTSPQEIAAMIVSLLSFRTAHIGPTFFRRWRSCTWTGF